MDIGRMGAFRYNSTQNTKRYFNILAVEISIM